MRELRQRAGQIVKAVCVILAVLVVCQLAGMVTRWNPFRGVAVPELPSLTNATNGPAEGAPNTNLVAATTGRAGTNKTSNTTSNPAPPGKSSTNSSVPLASAKTNSVTNSITAATLAEKGTTAVAQAEAAVAETNTASDTATNTTSHSTTNTPSMMAADASLPLRNSPTNLAMITTTNGATNGLEPSVLTSAPTGAGRLATNQGTNLVVSAAATGTNAAATKAQKHPPAGGPGRGLAGRHGADLPPAVQARIQQIVDCELLAPVMHPLPMALLGIAGDVAFLRSANGQTGMVKEGDSLDDLKLLRIGINRVLVEQEGQKTELMIFSGYGGDSLLPTNSTNENSHS